MNIKKFFNRLTGQPSHTHHTASPQISIKSIPDHVLTVVDKLWQAGYEAYLVGGCVRDLLTHLTPKDFDVATSAKPQEIRRLFRHSRLIGRRFLLVHVYFGKETVEVATFRGNSLQSTSERVMSHTGQILEDNTYGTIEEDALRRDFTINALFYDPREENIVDYAEGLQDIQKNLVRLIGDPETRFREDPMRMLRALRFSAKLNFAIDKATETPLYRMSDQLLAVPSARLFEETLKLFTHGYAVPVLVLLRKYGFEKILFKVSETYGEPEWHFIHLGLTDTDERYREHKSCSIAFLLSLFLFGAYRQRLKVMAQEQSHRIGFLEKDDVINDVLQETAKTLTIPKRLTAVVRATWHLQYALVTAKPHQVARIISHPQFRPAMDLLWLRANTNEPTLHEWATWWKTNHGHVQENHSRPPARASHGFPRRRKPAEKRI